MAMAPLQVEDLICAWGVARLLRLSDAAELEAAGSGAANSRTRGADDDTCTVSVRSESTTGARSVVEGVLDDLMKVITCSLKMMNFCVKNHKICI